ncbi:MAG: hypothetical protein H8E00_00425 [Deltaproteobacteria bacterium]|nr:hypothetical protein [Deltaproteobacteria bacterium]
MKMKLYVIYTPSHSCLLNDWFLPTIKDDLSLIIRHLDNNGSGYYRTKGWNWAILAKTALIIEAINANMGSKFIFSDVDIQFFDKFECSLDKLSDNYDIICQAESPFLNYCTGFFVCRASKVTLQFWEEILLLIKRNPRWHDQDAFNFLAKKTKYQHLRFGILPYQYIGGGTFSGVSWHPGNILPIPKGIIMHHANFTKGVPNKIAQLLYVKRMVTSKILLSIDKITKDLEPDSNGFYTP